MEKEGLKDAQTMHIIFTLKWPDIFLTKLVQRSMFIYKFGNLVPVHQKPQNILVWLFETVSETISRNEFIL